MLDWIFFSFPNFVFILQVFLWFWFFVLFFKWKKRMLEHILKGILFASSSDYEHVFDK